MKAWTILIGTLAIIGTGVSGFFVEKPKSVVPDPAIWPQSILDAYHRQSIELLLNEKMYAPDLDNILLDSGTKKSAEKIESCSSSSDEPQRLKRSEDSKIIGIQQESNSTNLSDLKSSEDTMITGTRQESHIVSKRPTNVTDLKISEDIEINGNLHKSNSTNVTDLKESTIESLSSPEAETLDITVAKTSDNESPRNVVFLLIDDAGIGRETMWKNFETSQKFNVQGFLQNCRVDKIVDTDKASSGAPLVSGGTNEECNCERYLRENVGALLSWSRHVKEMNTATIWATNFSNPLSFGTDGPSIRVRDLDENVEPNGMRKEVPRLNPSIGNNGRMMYPDKQSIPSSPSTPVSSPAKQDGINGFDGMWDVFDMFSRIRIAFFRILLESLGNLSGNEDEFGTRRYFPLQPSVVELITDSLKDLESELNDKGFMLVVTAQGNELSAAIDVLRREVSIKDTLIVVAGMCSKINESVPFFAEGPGDKTLREARTIWDLPSSIRIAISNCSGQQCSDNPRLESIPLPSELYSVPQDLPRKRVVRAKEEDETNDSTAGEKSIKDTAEEVEEKSTPKPGKRSENGVGKMRVDTIAAILGIVTSVTAALALNS